MNYGTNEAVAITLTIAYDNANQVNEQTGAANGVGIAIQGGRTVGSIASGTGT
jgi:hypothetical protein